MIRLDPENVGNPLFHWLALTTTNSMCLRPHRFFQIVENLLKQNFGKEIARIGVKNLLKKWDAPGLALTKSIPYEPEAVDVSALKNCGSWEEAQRLVLEMAFGPWYRLVGTGAVGGPPGSSSSSSSSTKAAMYEVNAPPPGAVFTRPLLCSQRSSGTASCLDDGGSAYGGPMSPTSPSAGVLARTSSNAVNMSIPPPKMYTVFELAQADVAGLLLKFYDPQHHFIEPLLITLLQNIVTLTESLPLIVLNEKKRNPHGMQLITEPVWVEVNKSHSFSLEPWTPMSELCQRCIAGKMQALDPSTGEPTSSTTSTGGEFSRAFFRNCLDLVGSILVSMNLEYFDVLDFTVKTKLGHPVHLLCPSQRMRNMGSTGAGGVGGGRVSAGAAEAHQDNLGRCDGRAFRCEPRVDHEQPICDPNRRCRREQLDQCNSNNGIANSIVPSYRQFIISKNYGWGVAVRLTNDQQNHQKLMVAYASHLNAQGQHIAINPSGVNIHPLSPQEKCLKLWFLLSQQQFGKGELLDQVGVLLSLAKRNWVAERQWVLTRGGGASCGESMAVVSNVSTPTPSVAKYASQISGNAADCGTNSEAGDSTAAPSSARNDKAAPEMMTRSLSGGMKAPTTSKTTTDLLSEKTEKTTSAMKMTKVDPALGDLSQGLPGGVPASEDLPGAASSDIPATLSEAQAHFQQCVKVITGPLGTTPGSSPLLSGTTSSTNIPGGGQFSPAQLVNTSKTAPAFMLPGGVQNIVVGPNGQCSNNQEVKVSVSNHHQYLQPWCAEALFALGYRPSSVVEEDCSLPLHYALGDEIYELFSDSSEHGFSVGEITDSWVKVLETDVGAVDFLQSVYEKLQFEKENSATSVHMGAVSGGANIGDFVFAKCRACLGKSTFSDELFNEGLKRLEKTVTDACEAAEENSSSSQNNNGNGQTNSSSHTTRGAIWGGLTKRMADNLATQLSDVIPCHVEPDPTNAAKWGVKPHSILANMIKLRALVQYNGGLGYVVDINSGSNLFSGPQSSIGSGIVSPGRGFGTGIGTNNSSSTGEYSPVAPSHRQQQQHSGNNSSASNSVNEMTARSNSNKTGLGTELNRKHNINTVTYTICDVYTGEIVGGLTRSQIDPSPNKTKIEPSKNSMLALRQALTWTVVRIPGKGRGWLGLVKYPFKGVA
eukprot:g4189.t1